MRGSNTCELVFEDCKVPGTTWGPIEFCVKFSLIVIDAINVLLLRHAKNSNKHQNC